MSKISANQHETLIVILQELLTVISKMRQEEEDYLLIQNENEAKEWLDFLQKHTDKEELKSLEIEISDRFFYKFDVQIGNSDLDNKRAELIKTYIIKSCDYLK